MESSKDLFINKELLIMIYEFCDPITKFSFYLTKDWSKRITYPIVSKKDKCLSPFYPFYPRDPIDKVKYMNATIKVFKLEGKSDREKDRLSKIYARQTTNSTDILEKTTVPRGYFLSNKNHNIFLWAYNKLHYAERLKALTESKKTSHRKYTLPTLLLLRDIWFLKWEIILCRQDLSLSDYKTLTNKYSNFNFTIYKNLNQLLIIRTLDIVLWIVKKQGNLESLEDSDCGTTKKWRDFECVKWAYENRIISLLYLKAQCILWGRLGLEYYSLVMKSQCLFSRLTRDVISSTINLQDFIWYLEILKNTEQETIFTDWTLIFLSGMYGSLFMVKYFYKNYQKAWQENKSSIEAILRSRNGHFIKWYNKTRDSGLN